MFINDLMQMKRDYYFDFIIVKLEHLYINSEPLCSKEHKDEFIIFHIIEFYDFIVTNL